MTFNLMLGDCLERMKEIPDGSVDLVLTDPPYGMDYQSKRRVASGRFNKIKGDSDLFWIDAYLEEVNRVLKDNSAGYVFCSWHKVDVFKQAVERLFKIKNILVWVKNNHGSGDLKGAYAPKYEFIIFFHKGRTLLKDGRKPDVLDYAKVNPSTLCHPTEKPVDLVESLVRMSSDEGGIVLDSFMGSGTTGVACKNTNRNFIGIELDPTYFTIAENRINDQPK